jgi:carbonic anhydrase/acetyltransferase-like protein (isoleucine patch superfamily)
MIRSFNGKTPRIAGSAFVSEAACVIGDVEIGEHASVWPGAVIRADTGPIIIGDYSIVEDNCVIHSGVPPAVDVVIGEKVNVGHGAVIHCARIGHNVLIGINAVLLHRAEIGNYCLIGAACLVGEDMKVPDYSFVVGVPGKIRGKVPDKLMPWLTDMIEEYADWAEMYKEQGL